jgi:hypothetical protein
MPIRKFRTLEEAEKALWREPFDPENLRVSASVTNLAMGLARITLPKGVFKYRSLEEADQERDRQIAEMIRERRKEI